MHACETMGGANYICTDKTGTLTKNEMSVFKVLTGKNDFQLKQNVEVDNVGTLKAKDNNKKEEIREEPKKYFENNHYWELLKISIALNVECTITKNTNEEIENYETKNKTDKAFIDFLCRFSVPIGAEKNKYLSMQHLYKQFPFDSKRKRMTTFVKNDEFPSKYRLFSKGGGENSTTFCKKYLDPESGKEVEMDEKCKKRIQDSISNFNKDKLRSLYIAYKDITKEEFTNCEKANDEGKLIDQYDMVFLAVFGIRDSLRDGVIEAVKKCHEASVKVIMVTGDNIVTATAIAKECGILGDEVDLRNLTPQQVEDNPEAMNIQMKKRQYIKELLNNKPKALTGNSFYNVVGGLICDICRKETNLCKCPKTEAEAEEMKKRYKEEDTRPIKKDVIRYMDNFKTIIENLSVMARSQPIHKYALVLGLKALKNVVAVTGDGTNDAPALSKSDVGFAMFAGTDIAKEASDIVIIDNNFSSIITAIIYGRNIYDNIRKFLQFQLSVNFCACIIVFICACIGNETPLTPIQMLWVNLIMDSLGSLALATEPPYPELLQRAPTKRNESIINITMWKHIILQSFIQIVILLILYLIAPTFIKEADLERLAENTIINYCYESMPGKSDYRNIIYGSESNWSTKVKLKVGIDKNFCGKYASRQSLSVAYKEYSNANGGSVHMTMIFNVFVIYTLFNQINCRIINDSFNIFQRITNSILFPLITLIEMILQIIIVCFGKSIFHVANNGLTGEQWGYCFGFSAITFIVSILVKFLKIEKCFNSGDSRDKVIDDSEDSTSPGSNTNSKKVYDKPVPIDVQRIKEKKDFLQISENSSIVPKENEEL
jgi:Ca2+ transporting ATPase